MLTLGALFVLAAPPQTPPPFQGSGSGPAIVWKDRNGVVVTRAVTGTIVNGLYYFDADGNVWNLTTQDGAVFPALGSTGAYFEGESCTGNAWIVEIGPMARFTFEAGGIGFYSFDDAAAQQSVVVRSASLSTNFGCVTFSDAFEVPGVPLNAQRPATLPVLNLAPPLHPELP